MISVPVYDQNGQQVGEYSFSPDELAKSINKQLLHDVVVMYEANKRVGTVQTLTRGMVAGTTKKLFKQKGTGRARMGTKRSPIRRGGGHTFAKVPKDWSYRLPRQAVRLATRMALLSKFQDNQVKVIDSIDLPEPKTRHVATMLKKLGVDTTSSLLTIDSHNPELWRSARNIESLQVSVSDNLNAYDLLRQRMLIVTREALDRLRQGSPSKPAEQVA